MRRRGRCAIVQVERDRFDLLLVTVDEAAYRRVVESIVAELRDLLHGAQVNAERRDELTDGGRAKFRPVVALGDG